MGRMIVGVIAGYLMMCIGIVVTFAAAYFAMGPDRAYQPGTYDVTPMWIAVSIILGFLAAMFGGWLASRIGRSLRTAHYLAIVVVVLGLVMAIPTLNAPREAEVRDDSVSTSEAMLKAQQPPAVSFLNPLIGGLGVLLGARLGRKPGA